MHQLDKLDSPEAMQAAIADAVAAAKAGTDFPSLHGDGSSASYRRSTKWVVRTHGLELDSKPLLAAAYRHQFGQKLTEKVYGGSRPVVAALDRFGYRLELRSQAAAAAPAPAAAGVWTTPVGEEGSKKDFSKLYGGSTMGGIQPSASTSNVLIYSDPAVGTTYGYNFDGWTVDGSTYSYTGEGRRGPQSLSGGNGTILHHKRQGRALRLFVADGYVGKSKTKKRIYIGEFSLDEAHPYSIEDAVDEDGVMRTVYVFHLLPVSDALLRANDYSDAPMNPQSDAVAEKVPLEKHLVNEYASGGSAAVTAEKREQLLVESFSSVLEARGHQLSRWKITPPESTRPLYSDLFDETSGVLYEAKAQATRNHVRMGLGQILDYKRYTPDEVKEFSLLLPTAPHTDLLDLLRSQQLSAVWPAAEAGSFVKLTPEGVTAF